MDTWISSLRQKNSPSELLASFLNLNFYLLISPFKVYHDSASGKFYSFLLTGCRRICVACLHIFFPLYFFILFVVLKSSNSRSDSQAVTPMKDEVAGFVNDCISSLWLMMNILMKFTLWTCASEIANALNFMLNVQRRIQELEESSTSASKSVICIVLVYIMWAISTTLMEVYHFINGLISSRNSSGSNSSLCEDHGGLNLYCSSNILTNIVSLAATVHEDFVTTFGVSYILILAVLLFESSRSFERHCHKERNEVQKILSSCKLLIQLSSAIKRSSGMITSVVSFGTLLYYSQRLQGFFSLRWDEIVLFSFFIMTQPMIFVCGAKTNSVISSFAKILMSKTYDEASLPCKATSTYWERTLILHAIDTNGAGLKGRTYTATFSMLGNILGHVVTYAIAIIQFQQ